MLVLFADVLSCYSPADIAVLRWCYKRGRELARRMRSFRGEIPAAQPDFRPSPLISDVSIGTSQSVVNESTASVNPTASGPVPIDAPKIVYSKEDDRAIDDYIKATGEKGRLFHFPNITLTFDLLLMLVGTTWHSVCIYFYYSSSVALDGGISFSLGHVL